MENGELVSLACCMRIPVHQQSDLKEMSLVGPERQTPRRRVEQCKERHWGFSSACESDMVSADDRDMRDGANTSHLVPHT